METTANTHNAYFITFQKERFGKGFRTIVATDADTAAKIVATEHRNNFREILSVRKLDSIPEAFTEIRP